MTVIDLVVLETLTGRDQRRNRRGCGERRLRERIHRFVSVDETQPWLIDERHAPLRATLQLHETHAHSVTLNFDSAASSTVSPSPGVFSSRSMNPSFATGSPLK